MHLVRPNYSGELTFIQDNPIYPYGIIQEAVIIKRWIEIEVIEDKNTVIIYQLKFEPDFFEITMNNNHNPYNQKQIILCYDAAYLKYISEDDGIKFSFNLYKNKSDYHLIGNLSPCPNTLIVPLVKTFNISGNISEIKKQMI